MADPTELTVRAATAGDRAALAAGALPGDAGAYGIPMHDEVVFELRLNGG